MTERAEVTTVPAKAPIKVPGLRVGETTDLVLFVLYDNGDQRFRCVQCSKEYETFGSCWAHHTHHSRTRSSYQWDRTGKRTSKGKAVLQDMISAVVTRQADVIAAEIVEIIHSDLNSSITSMSEEVASLKQRLDEERTARIKAERDLNKIRNLFKG
jgi:hypothetical protein